VITEFIKFRVFNMPCCHMQLCWVNPRLPTYCPECGSNIYMKLRYEEALTLVNDEKAQLRLTGVTGGG